ncbi:hypothetical protein AAVH_03192 [Aphelenchoides avenae]|nr:hypothetical protein AAVH_03192 [Aphelenchus avenae]
MSAVRNKAFFNPIVTTAADAVDCSQPNFELLYASMDRGASLRVKSLDESTCSSGYGSQDSTPESSVHSPDWQPSSQLERRGILVDKAVECKSVDLDETERYLNVFKPQPKRYEPSYGTYDPLDDFSRIDDDHVYHELESLNRISMLFNDNVAYVDDNDITSPTASFKHCPGEKSPSRSSSPIYAVPYEGTSGSSTSSASPRNDDAASVCGGYRRVKRVQREKLGPAPFPVNDDTYGPLEIASPFYASSLCRSRGPAGSHNMSASAYVQGPSSAYEHYSSMPPFLHIPPPPPKEADTFFQDNYYYPPRKANDVDFLAELDQQIAELQASSRLQSDAVRQMVEQAKERRELRVRTRQLCMEHLRELRKMRWFMHNNFELRL